ncbi:MAG: hypothetical protein KFH98_02230 [Gemmatimonadetes bacterium]|nr:hypothetical protein [Gemmatimonadota bacterium]
MRDLFEANGDTWRVTRSDYDPGRAVHTVVFNCVSNSQRPYRVVQVPDPMPGGGSVDALDDRELTELFSRTQTMDYSHDRAANPQSHGYGDPPQK